MTTLTEPLSIVDYATGVSGSYCIGKRNPTGFWSYWNPSGWAGSGYLFEDRKLAERVLQLLDVIEAAMSDPRVPVAWLHADHRTAYVITDKVKQVWLQVDPKHVEHYTVPLYLDRWDGATLLRAPMALEWGVSHAA